MTKINLLPWREVRRKQKQKDFINSMELSALLGILVVGLIHTSISGLKVYQEQRNELLKNEILVLDKKIIEVKDIEEKKKQLQAKINLIQQLQESRPEAVHLIDEIPKLTPEGIFLTKFTQAGSELTFEGKSESNGRISAFMKAIDKSLWLQKPTLAVIKSSDKSSANKSDTQPLSDFKLNALQGKQNNIAESGSTYESSRN
jgi:type IV pilus assembly protein PilN